MKKTVICPKCHRAHVGPRPTDELRVEGSSVLIRALDLPDDVAAEYLRTQWLGGGLELSGWCINCIFAELAATAPGARGDELERVTQLVTQTPTAALAEREYAQVIPMGRYLAREARELLAARGLLQLGSPKAEEKP